MYRNGDPDNSFDLKLTSTYKPKDIAELIENKLRLKPVQKLRIFTSEGLEISIEELNYIKDGDSVFVSRGKDLFEISYIKQKPRRKL